MPLIGPILDDRTFEQLRDELVKRIPVYAPEWTDHNTGDPGIALLELFAHLASRCSSASTRSPTPPRSPSFGCSAYGPGPP